MPEYLLYFPDATGTDWVKVLTPVLGKNPNYRTTDRDHVIVECEETALADIKAANPALKSDELMVR